MATPGRLRPTRAQWIRALLLFALGVAGFLAVVVLLPHSPQLFATGTAPPALTLDDIDGAHHDVLAEARGRGAVIEFFETGCPTCRSEASHVCSLAAAHPVVRFYAVDAGLEDAATIRAFQREHMPGCSVTFLTDPGALASHAWAVSVVPTVYLLGADGTVAYGGVGDDGIKGLDAAIPHG